MASNNKIINKEFIDSRKRHYILEGISKEILCSKREEPIHTSFGSTDRKSYTVQISYDWAEEHAESFVDIPPWVIYDEDIINHAIEKGRYKFASLILDKYFN